MTQSTALCNVSKNTRGSAWRVTERTTFTPHPVEEQRAAASLIADMVLRQALAKLGLSID